MNDNKRLPLLILLVSRLERLSADSRWSHRASGLRGNIIKLLEESSQTQVALERFDRLIKSSFEILRSAAMEIPDLDNLE